MGALSPVKLHNNENAKNRDGKRARWKMAPRALQKCTKEKTKRVHPRQRVSGLVYPLIKKSCFADARMSTLLFWAPRIRERRRGRAGHRTESAKRSPRYAEVEQHEREQNYMQRNASTISNSKRTLPACTFAPCQNCLLWLGSHRLLVVLGENLKSPRHRTAVWGEKEQDVGCKARVRQLRPSAHREP